MFQNSVLESYDGSDATWEIVIMLVVAFILGYILRYLIGSRKASKMQELESDNRHLAGRVKELERSVSEEKRSTIRLTEELDDCREKSVSADQLAELEQSLADLRQQNSQLQSELSLCLASKKAPETMEPEVADEINPLIGVAEPQGSVTVEAPPVPDNLKIVEGIGPKIERMLNSEGIYTFAQLASADRERLRNIMAAEGPKFLAVHDPTTWPKQAKLAAEESWEDLEAYKGRLKGGREVN
ncbi:MAG: helix-hairpin-helix domain-containing protein [Bacteroidota bacterium]